MKMLASFFRGMVETIVQFFPLLSLAALGLTAATLGSMVGMGGGSFITPCLLLFWGVDPVTAVSASLLAVLASASSASLSYWRAGTLDTKNAKAFAVFAVLGAMGGALLLLRINPLVYPLVLGIFLFLTGFGVLRSKAGGFQALEERIGMAKSYFKRRLQVVRMDDLNGKVIRVPFRRRLGYLISFMAGLASAIFGVGGGAILTPGLIVILHYPARNAIATAQGVMAAGALAALLLLVAKGGQLPAMAWWIALGAWAGGQLGSRIARGANEVFLTRTLATALLLVGSRLLWVYFLG